MPEIVELLVDGSMAIPRKRTNQGLRFFSMAVFCAADSASVDGAAAEARTGSMARVESSRVLRFITISFLVKRLC